MKTDFVTKSIKLSKKVLVFSLIFLVLFLGTRLPRISNDEINPDGVNWHYRMQQFVVGLKTGQLEKTYQHYHPGVTFMWIAGIPVEIYKQLSGINTYDMYNFQTFHLVAKLSIVFSQLILSFIAIFLLSRFVTSTKAFLVVGLMSLEPFFVGNSRLFHMDVLLTLFLFNALLTSFLALMNKSRKTTILAGVLLSASFLTKSIGIGALVFVLFYSVFYLILNKGAEYLKKFIPILLVSFIVSLFLIFPAMFKNPVYFLSEIFSESERVGVRDGHGQIIFGEYTREAGLFFYPLVLLMKVSPFTVVGIFAAACFAILERKRKKINLKGLVQNPVFFATVFYVGYFVVMSFPTKKIDRYMIPMYPVLAWVAVLGFEKIWKIACRRVIFIRALVLVSFASLIIIPNIKLFPYLFTYTSPVFGSAESANKVIAQKPFGIGIFDLKSMLVSRYGPKAKLGFIDVKPIEAIYPNSQVFDMRVNGPGSYDYVVLGVNEQMPEKVVSDSRFLFEKDYSMYINGLEYWRICAKKIK